jgi:hypothetical protein
VEEELRGLGVVGLHARMAAGGPVRLDALDDTEFHGVSLGLPGWVERLAWTTFKKVFRRDPGTGALRGWNVAVEQRGVQGPFVDRRRRGGERVTYGHYAVRSAAGVPMPRDYWFGAVIDYATGGNAPWDPVRFTFDPLVSLAPGGDDLLLGYSVLRLGPALADTPAFFLLRRGGPLSYDEVPPWR